MRTFKVSAWLLSCGALTVLVFLGVWGLTGHRLWVVQSSGTEISLRDQDHLLHWLELQELRTSDQLFRRYQWVLWWNEHQAFDPRRIRGLMLPDEEGMLAVTGTTTRPSAATGGEVVLPTFSVPEARLSSLARMETPGPSGLIDDQGTLRTWVAEDPGAWSKSARSLLAP